MTPFSFPEFLLAIASAAALLVWSVRLVRTGFERAFGPELRAGLRKSTSNRVYAALTGAVAAFLLQSATGVSVLVAGFMSSSAIAPLPAFAMLLGCRLGAGGAGLGGAIKRSGLRALADGLRFVFTQQAAQTASMRAYPDRYFTDPDLVEHDLDGQRPAG